MACIDNWDGLNSGQQMACLKTTIAELKDEIKGMTRESNNLSSHLGSSGNILKDMASTVGGMVKNMKDFTLSFSQQYKLGEQIAQSYKKTSLQIGLSVGRAKDLSDQFKGAVANVAKFGGELGDVESIYSDFADSSGRVRIMDEGDVANVFKLSKAANLYGSEATNLYETLDLMGVSNEAATQRMTDLIKDSQKIGLNSSKVVKVLANNMKSLQSYSFASGVKGMTDMAKLGVKLRMDVSSMLGMAEKFYQPEAAIEAVANLQMLGGDIADAFGDPFEIMYLARNKPEELAKKLESMTENMMTFNSETGEYEFPAEARMQLKAAGEQLGINTEQMIEMARQTSKMKDVKNKLSMGGMFSDEEMEGIASMARLEDGQFKVDFRNKDGEKITKSIDELQKGDFEMLLKPPANEKDYQTDMLYNSQTTNEHLSNIEDAYKKGIITQFDAYQVTEDATNEPIKATDKLMSDMLISVKEGAKEASGGILDNLINGLKDGPEKLGHAIADKINMMNIFGEGKPLTVENANIMIDTIENFMNSDDVHKTTEAVQPHGMTDDLGGTSTSISYSTLSEMIDNRGTKPNETIDKLISNGTQIGGNSGPISIEPITITINGDLSLNTPNGNTKLDLDMESISKVVSKMITDSLNNSNYSGGKAGSTLNSSMA